MLKSRFTLLKNVLISPTPSLPISRALSASALRFAPNLTEKVGLLNEDIPYAEICLVDSQTKKLNPPQKLVDILLTMDRTLYSIKLVDEAHNPPICVVLEESKNLSRVMVGKDGKRKIIVRGQRVGDGTPYSRVAPKEIHFTYTSSKNDVAHKLSNAMGLLGLGKRVTVYFRAKSKSPKLPLSAEQEVVQKIQDELVKRGARLNKGPYHQGSKTILEFHPDPNAHKKDVLLDAPAHFLKKFARSPLKTKIEEGGDGETNKM